MINLFPILRVICVVDPFHGVVYDIFANSIQVVFVSNNTFPSASLWAGSIIPLPNFRGNDGQSFCLTPRIYSFVVIDLNAPTISPNVGASLVCFVNLVLGTHKGRLYGLGRFIIINYEKAVKV